MTTTQMTLPDITAGTVYFVIYAQGYPPPGDYVNVAESQSQPITPIAVSHVGIWASRTTVSAGTQVTLTWSAVAATGFTLDWDLPRPGQQQFQANQTTYSVTVDVTTTYVITALGYTGGGQNPTAYVTVTVPKPPKEKDKEGNIEKFVGKERETPAPDASLGSGGTRGAELPSGSQQPFIGPDERPDVGAHLRDNGVGA
jgi:hypothetical protein